MFTQLLHCKVIAVKIGQHCDQIPAFHFFSSFKIGWPTQQKTSRTGEILKTGRSARSLVILAGK